MTSSINIHNRDMLAMYGIILKKELKSSAVLQLKQSQDDIRISKPVYEKLINAIENSNKSYCIQMPKVTFGVEFEFVGSNKPEDVSKFNIEMCKIFKEKYFYSGAYTHNDGESWILGRDGSIRVHDSNIIWPFGYELSTPKLNLLDEKDVSTLTTVINLCKEYLQAEVNKSCGTHIHIGFKYDKIFRGNLCDLLKAYSYMEKTVFDPIVPTSRRRNRYCRQTQPWPRNKYQKLSTRFCEFNYDGECRNLHFEFRQLEGTLDVDTIVYWAELQLCILYDLISHIDDIDYIQSLMKKNIFEILFHYNFSQSLISFFINRLIQFRSKTFVQADNINKGININI
jgi:hypothetical protein